MLTTRTPARALAALGLGTVAALALAGCSGSPAGGIAPADIPGDLTKDVTVSFWHVYQGADQAALDGLIQRFEEENPRITVDAQFTGGFAEQQKKLVSALQAGDPPNLAIAYPADVLRYQESRKVLNLTPYIEDDAHGLSEEDLEDVFEIERTINRYEVAEGDYLSFPFTANTMVMYYNEDLLASAGISAPPETWDEFVAQCATIKEELGLACLSARGDGSSMDALAGAFGGVVKDDKGEPGVGEEAWTRMLEQLQELAEAGYAEVAGGAPGQVTGPDLQSFISQRAAFVLGTSRNIGFFPDSIGDAFAWGAAAPPQPEKTDAPVSVLYGPGVVAFSDDPQKDLATWQLIRFLTGAEAQSIWATETGQLPVRASVAESEAFKARLQESPARTVAFSLMTDAVWDGALGEHGVIEGVSQKERELLASVMNAVLLGDMTAQQAQQQLQAGIGR
ncbi:MULTISPECIES: extracellular solute-binding protein [Microbacterium]|uniref:extracellular solute-binding protein n=1 Tax=Microbacterium TaxID=33882 RepID=UPI0030103B13